MTVGLLGFDEQDIVAEQIAMARAFRQSAVIAAGKKRALELELVMQQGALSVT